MVIVFLLRVLKVCGFFSCLRFVCFYYRVMRFGSGDVNVLGVFRFEEMDLAVEN